MASINLYLPPDLKKRMDEIGNLGWSRIAQAAFEKVLAGHRDLPAASSRPARTAVGIEGRLQP